MRLPWPGRFSGVVVSREFMCPLRFEISNLSLAPLYATRNVLFLAGSGHETRNGDEILHGLGLGHGMRMRLPVYHRQYAQSFLVPIIPKSLPAYIRFNCCYVLSDCILCSPFASASAAAPRLYPPAVLEGSSPCPTFWSIRGSEGVVLRYEGHAHVTSLLPSHFR